MKMVMPELVIGNFTARLPIIQGGMAVGLTLADIAAAVGNAGGIGVIAASAIGETQDDCFTNFEEACIRALREEIQKARKLSPKGILGVNIMVAGTNAIDMVITAIEEGIDIIFGGAGLALDWPKYLVGNQHTALVPIVSSARAAKLLCKRWQERHGRLPDAVVVEGPKAGGHLGFKTKEIDDPNFALEELIPEVVAAVKVFEDLYGVTIPVIAAGGIWSGKDAWDIMQKGASGVQLGTRFVTTEECAASDEFKQAYINASEGDIVVIDSPVHMPGHALMNPFIERLFEDKKNEKKRHFNCPVDCIIPCDNEESPYCIVVRLINAKRGGKKIDYGLIFAGINAWKAKEIISVSQLMNDLVHEYEEAATEASK